MSKPKSPIRALGRASVGGVSIWKLKKEEREEEEREDDSLRSSQRLSNSWSSITNLRPGNSSGPKRKRPGLGASSSQPVIVSQQSPAFEAKNKADNVATEPDSHNQNGESTTNFAAISYRRPSGNPAFVAEAEGRRHPSAVRRNLSKRSISLLGFFSGSGDSINMCSVMAKCFSGRLVPARIRRIRLCMSIFISKTKGISANLFRSSSLSWIRSGTWSRSRRATKSNWCFTIVCHIILLGLLSINASSANRQDTEMCPPFLAGYETPDKEWHEDHVACGNAVKFWTYMTFDQDKEAQKLLIGLALEQKKLVVNLPKK